MSTLTRRAIPGLAFVALFSVITFTGCDSNVGGNGRVEVRLTDAALDDLLEANVTITRVELVSDGDLDDEGDENIVVLMEDAFGVDLLTLQDGVDTLLALDEVPSGSYNQLRLIVDEDAHVLFTDSTTETLKIPSGSQSGIKVNLPEFELNDDDDAVEVLVDFDVNKSFVKAGASGKYVFKPVVNPVYLEVNGVDLDVDETQNQ